MWDQSNNATVKFAASAKVLLRKRTHPSMITNREYPWRVTAGNFRYVFEKRRSRIKKIPCQSPQATKAQLAPCQRPVARKTIKRLR